MSSVWQVGVRRRMYCGQGGVVFAIGVLFVCVCGSTVRADAFARYTLNASFELPVGSSAMDVLPDGRVVAISGDQLFVETGVASRAFSLVGTLPGAEISAYGAAFLSASPDGTQIAVGNNGGSSGNNFLVGVFDFPTLTGVWFTVNHFSATWIDSTHIAVAAGNFSTGEVVALDVTSPVPSSPIVVTLVAGIGGASGGVAFDQFGNLFAGNGFMSIGPSGTGAVRAFPESAWRAALAGTGAIDFESSGNLVVDILSATSLGFDAEGNLHVAGGDFSVSKVDFVALVRGPIALAAAGGGAAADILDAAQVRRLDPDQANAFNFYGIVANTVTRELLLRSAGETTVHVYVDPSPPIPAISEWGLAGMSLFGLIFGTLAFRRCAFRPASMASSRWSA